MVLVVLVVTVEAQSTVPAVVTAQAASAAPAAAKAQRAAAPTISRPRAPSLARTKARITVPRVTQAIAADHGGRLAMRLRAASLKRGRRFEGCAGWAAGPWRC